MLELLHVSGMHCLFDTRWSIDVALIIPFHVMEVVLMEHFVSSTRRWFHGWSRSVCSRGDSCSGALWPGVDTLLPDSRNSSRAISFLLR
jgi:hypothetical protein